MIVEILSNEKMKLYSWGKEIGYLGNEIVYEDNCCTFLYFYFGRFTRLYVVNGMNKNDHIFQVKDYCNLIASFNGKEAKRMKHFMDLEEIDKKTLYNLPEIFFKECMLIINQSNWLFKLKCLYNSYKREK